MKRHFFLAALVGLWLGLPWLALQILGQRIFGMPAVALEAFEQLTQILPGGIVTTGLELMIEALHRLQLGPLSTLGKAVEFGMAYAMALVTISLLAGLTIALLKRAPFWAAGISLAIDLSLITLFLAYQNGWGSVSPLAAGFWLAGLNLAWAVSTAWVSRRLAAAGEAEAPEDGRRLFLSTAALGSLALAGAALGLSRWLKQPEQEVSLLEPTLPGQTPVPSPTPPPTPAGFQVVDGTRPDLTPLDDFYRVDINLLPPGQEEYADQVDNLTNRLLEQGGDTEMSLESYYLIVDGLVHKPQTIDLKTIQRLPSYEVYGTLSCISNPVGGDLIGTTLFRGARLRDVLELAGLQPTAVDLKFTGVDGYTESLPVEAGLDPRTLLCYAMGSRPLSQEHGAPLRLFIPNRYGMKNPKWIIKIEAIPDDYLGYWQQRGWSEPAWVQTTSVIDAHQSLGDGFVQIGGIAFAGDRGIQRVELKVEGGPWQPAELNRPLSEYSWVLWSARLQLPAGQHKVFVRAVDGNGEVQVEQEADTYPDGATGYHSRKINLEN